MADWHCRERPAEAAAELLAVALRDVDAPRVAVPGGSAVAALPFLREQLGDKWSHTQLTFVDERCVPTDHPDSNLRLARATGALEGTTVVPLWRDGDTPAAAIARFEAQWSPLHAVLLGMGGDGHVASLFVGHAWPRAGLLAFVPNSPKPPPERLTLTPGALATATTAVVLAMGERKREALQRLHRRDPTLPASALDPIIVTDLHPEEGSND